MRRKTVLIAISAACLGGTGWLLAGYLKPKPKPTTAEQVVGAVMQSDPAGMSEKELDAWIKQVAAMAERLPPHEMQKLVEKALADETLRERFESLSPEDRQKLASMVSEEQRARMMAKMATGFVAMLRSLPPPLRKAALQQMQERRDAHKGEKGLKGQMSKERTVQWLAATTPTQRAEMVRAMRELRAMMKEANLKE